MHGSTQFSSKAWSFLRLNRQTREIKQSSECHKNKDSQKACTSECEVMQDSQFRKGTKGICTYCIFVIEVNETGGDERKGQSRKDAETVTGDLGQWRRATKE